jgi:hypothetical protein
MQEGAQQAAAARIGPRFVIAQVPKQHGNLCTPREQASTARAGSDLDRRSKKWLIIFLCKLLAGYNSAGV